MGKVKYLLGLIGSLLLLGGAGPVAAIEVTAEGLDMRCQPYIEFLNKNHADLITRLTGCAPTCDHGPKILWWKEEQPDAYAGIAKFVTPSGYVAGKMAGLEGTQAFMDFTFLHFSGLSDAQNTVWSTDICNVLGVDMDKLPRIVEPWEVVGEVGWDGQEAVSGPAGRPRRALIP